jgi:hypothetical protein
MDKNYYSANPNDHKDGIDFNSWDSLFDLQSRKDGANYVRLKDWLKTYFNPPQLIPIKREGTTKPLRILHNMDCEKVTTLNSDAELIDFIRRIAIENEDAVTITTDIDALLYLKENCPNLTLL